MYKGILEEGLDLAVADFRRIGRKRNPWEVQPKEDQIKCAIYKTFSNHGYKVDVEIAYKPDKTAPNARSRCDVRASNSNTDLWIEIKTGWAGKGWVNKPSELVEKFHRDLKRLGRIEAPAKGLFVLFLFCQMKPKSESKHAVKAIEAIKEMGRKHEQILQRCASLGWWELDTVRYFVWQI